MKFMCKPAGLKELEHAPSKFVNIVTLPAPPASVFEIFADADQWPRWFDDIKKVEWTSPKPFKVGTTRTVTLTTMTVYERYFLWEDDKRTAFCFTATGLPMFTWLVEDYQLRPMGSSGCEFTYVVGFELIPPLRPFRKLIEPVFKRMFRNAASNLVPYVRDQKIANGD